MFTIIVCSKWLYLRPHFIRILHKETYFKSTINSIYKILVTNNLSKIYSFESQPLFRCTYSSANSHIRYLCQSKIPFNHKGLKDKESHLVNNKGKLFDEDFLSIDSSKKLPLSSRLKNVLKHYYQGFRLLFIEVRLSLGYIIKYFKGKPLIRSEWRQILRTTSDMIYLTPFLIVLLLPFGTLAIPFLVKLFPGLLPSTFKRLNNDNSSSRARFKLKLEMANLLYNTIGSTFQRLNYAQLNSSKEFILYLNRIRTSREKISNAEIIQFQILFEDISLDKFEKNQLIALCKLLEISSIGPNPILKFRLNMRLRQLATDDKLINMEGVDSMEILDLREACEQRGMHSFMVADDLLKFQLNQWLDLHLNQKIPKSLLLFSRTFYFFEHF